jgi:CcmD family protein
MGFVLAVACVAWALVSAYVSRMAVANVRLAKRLERLEAFVGEQQLHNVTRAKVA